MTSGTERSLIQSAVRGTFSRCSTAPHPTLARPSGSYAASEVRTQNVDVTVRGVPCKEKMSTVVAELATSASASEVKGLELIQLDGSAGPQAHMPVVWDWLRTARPGDAEDIIARFDEHLDATTKPGKRR